MENGDISVVVFVVGNRLIHRFLLPICLIPPPREQALADACAHHRHPDAHRDERGHENRVPSFALPLLAPPRHQLNFAETSSAFRSRSSRADAIRFFCSSHASPEALRASASHSARVLAAAASGSLIAASTAHARSLRAAWSAPAGARGGIPAVASFSTASANPCVVARRPRPVSSAPRGTRPRTVRTFIEGGAPARSRTADASCSAQCAEADAGCATSRLSPPPARAFASSLVDLAAHLPEPLLDCRRRHDKLSFR